MAKRRTLTTSVGGPGTDWIEDILLQTEGPDTYDAWVAGDIAFSDPVVRRAFERFDELVLAPGRVWLGRERAAGLWHWDAREGLLDDPPSCWLFHKPSFGFTFEEWASEVAPFPTPPVDDGASRRTEVGGGYYVALGDRPEVRAALEFIVGPGWAEAQTNDNYLAPHREVDTSLYPDHVQPRGRRDPQRRGERPRRPLGRIRPHAPARASRLLGRHGRLRR